MKLCQKVASEGLDSSFSCCPGPAQRRVGRLEVGSLKRLARYRDIFPFHSCLGKTGDAGGTTQTRTGW